VTVPSAEAGAAIASIGIAATIARTGKNLIAGALSRKARPVCTGRAAGSSRA